ncbi:hypothetical protein AMJ80_12150 [bacterium SM23_31]|nr:MAG: hypothetical protein AMJ80_12150 [bacterium SM23_31]
MSSILQRLSISLCVVLVSLTARGNEPDHNVEDKMNKQSNPMDKFDFLIGTWHMEYISHQGSGTGTFKKSLDGKYVVFDYSVSSPTGETGAAHGIFAWDQKAKNYRYWWFENSGSYSEATCEFIDDGLLLMSWHDSLFLQTFQKMDSNKVELVMKKPYAIAGYDPVLEVLFTKK